MKSRLACFFLGSAICLGAADPVVSTKTALKSKSRKEHPMIIEDIPYLPFGISNDTPLETVEILLAFYSAESGAGKRARLRPPPAPSLPPLSARRPKVRQASGSHSG